MDNKKVMKRTQQETHLPSGSKGELKLSNLEVNKQYWVLLTAHNEKFSSRTAKVDFEPLNASGKYQTFKLIGLPPGNTL